MVQTILSALAPIVFTLLLGFVAAWRHDFGPKEASVLNRMVLLYAVPLALFVGTVRYVDFMDNFLAPTETCHTADNFGVALTIAEYLSGSGRDLMLAVALSYTVQSRFVDHANFMTRGFDHTAQLAFSLNAAAGRLLGLSEPQIANAIAMAAVSDASFAVIRAKPLSQWKGLASAQSALGAMNALFLARRDVEGPLQVIEGPNGIDNLLHMQIRIDWDKQGYEGVLESTIKKYNAMIHTQSAVHCMVELARQNKLDPRKVVSIEADVTVSPTTSPAAVSTAWTKSFGPRNRRIIACHTCWLLRCLTAM